MSDVTTVVGIDGDVLVYQAAWAAENDPLPACKHTLNRMIDKIVGGTGADEYVVFLTGKGNFRNDVAVTQPYKGNRADTPKPKHYADARQHLITKHGASVVNDCEADDALGEFLSNDDDNYHFICASIDKDLLMVPGHHYRWEMTRKGKVFPEVHTHVTEDDGAKFFFTQLLTGDSTDNIPGLFKYTGQRATKKIKEKLEGHTEPLEMYSEVALTYMEAVAERENALEPERLTEIHTFLNEIAQLLWIRHGGHTNWKDYYGIKD